MLRQTAGFTLPMQGDGYYIDIETLKKFKNSETITLKALHHGSNVFELTNQTISTMKMSLGPSFDSILKTTFVFYDRLDGKNEEIRLDHLHQDGFVLPDIENGDMIFYDKDIKPALLDTDYFLTSVFTDWPGSQVKHFKKRSVTCSITHDLWLLALI